MLLIYDNSRNISRTRAICRTVNTYLSLSTGAMFRRKGEQGTEVEWEGKWKMLEREMGATIWGKEGQY